MPYDCVVLVKQVPDTKNITGKAMKDDGTVNRAALPAIFNPEDLNALEMALEVKEKYGGKVTVICMGPPSASGQLRQALYRGADRVILLTDMRFAVADTLATSYTLSHAIRETGRFDLVLCGRQAIDGDTAQVGPQTAEKLGVPQLTYAEEILALEDNTMRVRRLIEGGYEIVEAELPVLLTVPGTANEPRSPNAKRLMQFKKARTLSDIKKEMETELEGADEARIQAEAERAEPALRQQDLLIEEWNVEAVGAEESKCGRKGSPTLVKKIESVVLTTPDCRRIEPTDDGISELIHELIEEHVLG